MAKEITVLVKFRGTVPEDVSIADIEEQIDCSLENSLRLNFSDSKEEDDDLREPYVYYGKGISIINWLIQSRWHRK